MDLDIKWQRHLVNFEKAFLRLQKATELNDYDELAQAGLIKTFEFTFELAWKTLKDLLEIKGYSEITPRDVIKRAFQSGYIQDGETWLDILEKRNLMVHTYDETKAMEVITLIKTRYFPEIRVTYSILKQLIVS